MLPGVYVDCISLKLWLAGIVWCMQHDSDSDDAMETETLHEGEKSNATDDSRTGRLSAKLSHSDSTVLSIASSYVRGLAGDQRWK